MFYFTVHPGDMSRTRLPAGCAVMLVASSCWDETRGRLKVRRPPADHISSLTIDSGGFTAARKWGAYPWSLEQYIEWVREITRDVPADFVASMDYACERGVDRTQLATNQERIRQTIENELRLRELAPDLPWLGVLQGNTLDERWLDIRIRKRLGLIRPLMGVGSICGRHAREAAEVIRFYRRHLPATHLHAFGLDVRTLDVADDVALSIASWDSYGWSWSPGQRGKDRPAHLEWRGGERWGTYLRRLAERYQSAVVGPRIERPRQLPLVDSLK